MFLHETLRQALPDKQIIVASDPGSVVLEGSVIFGHDPSTIEKRRSRYTYGVEIALPFRPQHHVDKKLISETGKVLCRHRFKVHVNVGDA